MDMLMLFKQFLTIETLVTVVTSKLKVSGVFTPMITQALRCGKAVTTLITNESSFSVVESLMYILEMSTGELFRAEYARKSFLFVVKGSYVV